MKMRLKFEVILVFVIIWFSLLYSAAPKPAEFLFDAKTATLSQLTKIWFSKFKECGHGFKKTDLTALRNELGDEFRTYVSTLKFGEDVINKKEEPKLEPAWLAR